jgi:hypothetical protein
MLRPFSWLLLLGLSAIASPAVAEIRALVIGIGSYPPDTGYSVLEGPPNDVRLMQDWLVKDWGANPSAVRTVTEQQATSLGIQEAIRSHLVEDTRPEDVAVLYFTGHGGQAPDLEGDETDGQDELLVSYDYRKTEPSTWLTDDLLHAHLRTIPARHVLILFDCCNAGTATRGVKGAGSPFTWKTRSTAVASTSFREKSAPDHHVYFAACGDGELARQIALEEGVVGVFTHGFLQMMKGETANASLDLFQQSLQEHVAQKVSERINSKLTQRPRVEASRRDFSMAALLKGQVFDSQPTPPISSPPTSAPPISFPPPLASPISFPPPLASPSPLPSTAPPSVSPSPPLPPSNGFALNQPAGLLVTVKAGAFYRWTELIQAEVTVSQDAHVRVFHVDSLGAVTQIFPNRIQDQTWLRAGETLQLPPRSPVNGRNYALKVGPPLQGLEALLAVASTEPFTDREAREFAAGAVGFNPLPDTPAEALGRGIAVEARPGPGSATASASPASTGGAIRIFRTSQY